MYSEVFKLHNNQNSNIINHFHVNKNAELFKEHFENFPIVPGAFSTNLCVQEIIKYLSAELSKPLQLKKIIKIQFINPIIPDVDIQVRVKRTVQDSAGLTVHFNLSSDLQSVLVTGIVSLGEVRCEN